MLMYGFAKRVEKIIGKTFHLSGVCSESWHDPQLYDYHKVRLTVKKQTAADWFLKQIFLDLYVIIRYIYTSFSN